MWTSLWTSLEQEAGPGVNEAQRLWDECAGIVRAQVSEPVWLTSFEEARAVDFDGTTFTLAVPSFLAKERIEGRYLSLVRDALTEVGAGDVELALQIAPREPEPAWTVAPPTPLPSNPVEHDAPGGVPLQDINPRYTFETFVIGPSNRFAHAAALAVAEQPARKYNPLFIYGDAGLGKTHLLQAIGHYVRENYPTYRVRYVTSEAFLNEFIDAVRTRTNDAFKRRYRDVDVLLVDDIQFMENKEGLQEEFFHTFNHLHQANRQIVLSSDRPPDAISTLEDRLRSRFKMGLITDVQPPDLETRLAILRKKALSEGLSAPDDALEYIASKISSNIRELEGALIRVTAFASLNRQPVDVALAEMVLKDLITDDGAQEITSGQILQQTAEYFKLSMEELCSKSRTRTLVTARQIAMYLIREIARCSFPEIGQFFQGRDHTTVLHSTQKIQDLLGKDPEVSRVVALLRSRIG